MGIANLSARRAGVAHLVSFEEAERLTYELLSEQSAHAKTADNFYEGLEKAQAEVQNRILRSLA